MGLHTGLMDFTAKAAIERYIAANRVDATSRDLVRLHATSTTVHACALFRAENVAQVPMTARRDGETLDDDHPLQRMFHSSASFSNLMLRSELSACYWGHNLIQKQRNAFTVPVGLRWLNPSLYSTDLHYRGGLRGFRIYPSSMYQIDPFSYLERQNAVYVHGVDFDDDFDGVSPAEVAFLQGSLDPEIAQTQLATFRNLAIPALLIQPEKDAKSPDVKDVTKLTDFFKRMVQGAVNAGKTLVSPARWDVKQLQGPLKDLEMTGISADARLAVCIAFRIPMEMIVPSAANYAQLEGARRTWAQAWLVPRVEWYASQFTEQLAAEFGPDYRVVPDFDKVPFLKEDARSRVEVANAKVTGTLITLYAAQKAVGEEPDDDLKDLYVVNGIPVPREALRELWKTQFAAQPTLPALPPPLPPSTPPTDEAAPIDADKASGGKSVCLMLDLANNADLIALQNRLREQFADAAVAPTWNAPDDFHVTLVVAPSATDEQIAALQALLDDVELPELRLPVGSLKSFDNLGNHALHFRIRRNGDLLDLQEALYDLCLEAGLAVSTYSLPASYTPHITMAYAPRKPRAITYGSKIAVTPGALLLRVGDATVWSKACAAEKSASSGKGAHLDDAAYKELRDWQALAGRKGRDYAFAAKSLDRRVSDFIRVALDDDDDLAAVFGEALALALDLLPSGKAYASTRAAFVDEMVRIIGAGQASEVSRQKFGGEMRSALRRYGLLAFRDGLNEGGQNPESLSQAMLQAFRAWQSETSGYISHLGTEVFRDGISVAEVRVRAELWANKSLNDARYRALRLVAGDKRYRWGIGQTEQHCATCLANHGQVRTMDEWARVGLPRSGALACGGWQCDCNLEEVREAEATEAA